MLAEFITAASADLIIATDAVPNVPIPEDDECLLFMDPNYGGATLSLRVPGRYDLGSYEN